MVVLVTSRCEPRATAYLFLRIERRAHVRAQHVDVLDSRISICVDACEQPGIYLPNATREWNETSSLTGMQGSRESNT